MKAKYGWMILGIILVLFCAPAVMAQCSICTKAASDLGDNAARGFNAGILYLAAVPMAVTGVIGYKWWKSNQADDEETAD